MNEVTSEHRIKRTCDVFQTDIVIIDSMKSENVRKCCQKIWSVETVLNRKYGQESVPATQKETPESLSQVWSNRGRYKI